MTRSPGWQGRSVRARRAVAVPVAGSSPPASGAYAKEYDEVKALGAVNSARSPEQEAVAQFYEQRQPH